MKMLGQNMRAVLNAITKILQVVLFSRKGQRAAISLNARRRDAPQLSHVLEDLRRLQLVSPMIDSRSVRKI